GSGASSSGGNASRAVSGTRWSRSSDRGTPNTSPAAPGLKRMPVKVSPGASRVGAGPVSGPATNGPDGPQMRSTHPSGTTSWCPASSLTRRHRQAIRPASAGSGGHSTYIPPRYAAPPTEPLGVQPCHQNPSETRSQKGGDPRESGTHCSREKVVLTVKDGEGPGEEVAATLKTGGNSPRGCDPHCQAGEPLGGKVGVVL